MDDLVRDLGPAASPGAQDLVREAFRWAYEVYGTERREDRWEVILHAWLVAGNVIRFGRRDPELVAAALLHDVLETTDTSIGEIERRSGSRVARLVEALTNEPGEDTAVSAERAVEAGQDAVFLRLCDRLDGVRHATGRRNLASRQRFLTATREVYLPLAEQHFPPLAAAMREALRKAEQTLG
jgi:GTP pyrophosphokinase